MKFTILRHDIRNVDMVEVRDDGGRLLATVTPGDSDSHLRVISKYAVEAKINADPPRPIVQALMEMEGKRPSDYPKAVEIRLDLGAAR